jgi:transcriptional regulator with XRE-family HTH domain
MEARRIGALVRAVRLENGLRQVDLADRCGMSQRWISDLERGRIEQMSIGDITRACGALDITARLDLWWRGGDADRLLDRDHAAAIEFVVAELERDGWTCRLEYGFNQYGDRGSVDILAWHPGSRSLLIIEVKATLTDVQALLAALAKKVRVVPGLVEREGWQPLTTSYLLVVLGSRSNRTVVARHARTFATTFPSDTQSVNGWIAAPSGVLHGLWFVSPATIRARQDARPKPRRARRAAEPLPTP